MSASQEAWEHRLGVVYTDTPKEPQNAVQNALGVVLDDLPLCAAGCGQRVVTRNVAYRALPQEARKQLQDLGVRTQEARGVCCGCYMRLKKRGELPQSNILPVNAPIEKRVDIPEIWNSVLESGGGYPELAERLEISREYARQIVAKLGLRKAGVRRRDSEERSLFLEELDRLLRFGVGVHELAQRFSLTDDELIEKVARLRERGLTQVRFDSYMEVAA